MYRMIHWNSAPVRGLIAAVLMTPVVPAHAAATSVNPPLEKLNPVADPRSVVTIGDARFTVLTPQLIRMEWAEDKKFEDHPSFVFLNRRMPVPTFRKKVEGETLTIDTDALHLVYRADSAGQGKFAPENLSVSLTLNGKTLEWHPGMPDTGNLMGTARTLDDARGSKTKAPIEAGLLSRDGWTMVDDSRRPLFDSDDFNFTQGEKSPWPWVSVRPAGDRLDWYFFGYGHQYEKELSDYVRVAGRIPLPPRFAFGSWWSRYWAYSDQELDNLVRGFHENDVPLDVLVIDMDWHTNYSQLEEMHETDQAHQRLGWTGYTWNPLLFPDPKAFLTHIHDQGLKATLNLHPASGVQPWEKAYPAMARAMGIDPATKKYVPFDITDKKYATNYMDLLHHPLEKQGIDFWWLDWQQQTTTNVPGVNPTWWLNYVHFTDQEREGKRPLLFHRWGGLGNHRYEIGFSGDTVSVWDSLAFQPWFTATAANVGYAYWSHDIGGHMPGVVDPELYTRWVQFGAFSPILRTHTTKNANAERRIWTYPEPYSSIMRKTFQLRYALEPYLYTEARRTYDSGVAFLHPLYYDWPEAEAAYTHKNEYVFGSQMIVAPVTAPEDASTHLASETVWIPKGEWIEVPTGKHFVGPTEVARSFSIDQVPVYVRAGAIIPMQPPMDYTDQRPVDPLILNIYPLSDGQESSYTLYEDNGKAEEYKHGECAWTTIHALQKGDELSVRIEPVKGGYPGMLTKRRFEVRLHGDWPPASVHAGSAEIGFQTEERAKTGWHFDGNTLTTFIDVPESSVHTPMNITILRRKGALGDRPLLDGFAGSMDRLRIAYDTLNNLHPVAWSPNRLIDAAQVGDRISYHPETAQEEMNQFMHRYADAMSSLQALRDSIHPKDPTSPSARETNEHRRVAKSTMAEVLLQLKDGEPSREGTNLVQQNGSARPKNGAGE